MIGNRLARVLARFLPPRTLADAVKQDAQIKGHFQFELREGGKLRQRYSGFNIWTLTGREFLAESMALQARSPRTRFRSDCIAYIGLGSGAQAEVSEISSLVDPVPYKTGEFLAALDTPATFPTSGSATSNTSVRFVREFSQGEISLGYSVVLTEAGLFTDGDPDDDWSVSALPTDFATTAGRAPCAYKAFEPATKSTQFAFKPIWDVSLV